MTVNREPDVDPAELGSIRSRIDRSQIDRRTAGVGIGLGIVAGRCPMGCGETLFLGHGGHVTCSFVDCPEPGAADALLHRPDARAEQLAISRLETIVRDDAPRTIGPEAARALLGFIGSLQLYSLRALVKEARHDRT